ncbi:MAG: alpha-N-acetylglucosaminidase TIM-barrel domain-containing protein [Candidatus Saccharimonadales bacterium]
MSDLKGWGGPVTQNMIDRRTGVETKDSCQDACIGNTAGVIGILWHGPACIKKHDPHAHILDQGKSAGGFVRPDFLLPDDPLFHQMAKVYYDEIKKLYGNDIHYFGGEPF